MLFLYSTSSRLPETMHLDDTLRNKPSEKAELFKNYLYGHFSDPSIITLILCFQTIKYLKSISIEIECINIFLILTLIKQKVPLLPS